LALDDYRIHAWTRTELIRLWVDLTALEYGVQNGVVYLRGTLRPHAMGWIPENGNGNGNGRGEDDRHPLSEVCLLASDVETVMRALPGVRDVVFQFDNVTKSGDDWSER
jgi:hypothetical protein